MTDATNFPQARKSHTDQHQVQSDLPVVTVVEGPGSNTAPFTVEGSNKFSPGPGTPPSTKGMVQIQVPAYRNRANSKVFIDPTRVSNIGKSEQGLDESLRVGDESVWDKLYAAKDNGDAVGEESPNTEDLQMQAYEDDRAIPFTEEELQKVADNVKERRADRAERELRVQERDKREAERTARKQAVKDSLNAIVDVGDEVFFIRDSKICTGRVAAVKQIRSSNDKGVVPSDDDWLRRMAGIHLTPNVQASRRNSESNHDFWGESNFAIASAKYGIITEDYFTSHETLLLHLGLEDILYPSE